MVFTTETQVCGERTRFKKGNVPWWIERNQLHPMKNPVVAKKVSETKKRLYKEGKLTFPFLIELNKRQKCENHPRWKGGRYTVQGYGYINNNGKPMLFHRYVMEKHLGRKLYPKEAIHHLDGDKLNCDVSNLLLCKNGSEHAKVHRAMEKIVYELIKEGVIKFNSSKKEFEYVSV